MKRKLTKEDRLQVLRKMLRAAGTMDRRSIEEKIKREIGVVPKSNLYNDLRTLTDNGEIEFVCRTHEAGEVLKLDRNLNPTLDGAPVKSYWKEWKWIGSKSEMIGGSILEYFDCEFFTGPSMKDAFRLDYFLSKPDATKRLNIIFSIGKTFLNLSIERDDLPFTIVLGRNQAGLQPGPATSKKFGSRWCYLAIKDSEMSGYKDPVAIGHAAITLGKNGIQAVVVDLGSKKGTAATSVPGDALKFIHQLFEKPSDSTLSKAPDRKMEENLAKRLTRIGQGQPTEFELPVHVDLNTGFKILIQ